MELTRERLVGIIAGAVGIAALLVYLILYRPVVSKLKTAGLECRAIETELSGARTSIASLAQSEMSKVLISEGDVSLAIDELTRHGKSKGINFISMNPKEIEDFKDAQCRILPIEMKIGSTYEELGVYLGMLERLEESLVTVRSFDMVSDEDTPGRQNTSIVLIMYLANK